MISWLSRVKSFGRRFAKLLVLAPVLDQ